MESPTIAQTLGEISADVRNTRGDVASIKEDVAALDKKIGEHYVSKEAFAPVSRIAYGILYFLVVSIPAALLTLLVLALATLWKIRP